MRIAQYNIENTCCFFFLSLYLTPYGYVTEIIFNLTVNVNYLLTLLYQ